MSQLRGAVIGAGYFSQFHYDAWSRIDGVQIVACCDVDESRVRRQAEAYGIGVVHNDFRAMLDEHAVDFVDIVTRPDTHLDICGEVARRGLPMICQKPLAPSAADGMRLVEMAEAASVPLMVHDNFRFQPWYREIKRLLEAGVIGSRLHTLSFRNRAGDGWGNDAYLSRQPYFRTMPRFLLLEAGIHAIDTFRYLAGEIDRVWCQMRKLNPVIAGEDTALAVFNFARGGVGVYDANRYNESTANDPRFTFGELLVEAEGGTIRLYDDGRLSVQRLGEAEQDHAYSLSRRGFAGDCVLATQRHFIECLTGGSSFETDGRSYLKSIAVQEAAYRSARTGNSEVPA